MSDNDDADRGEAGERRSAANRAHQAFDAARDFVAGADVGDLRAKASDAASALYKGGRDLLSDNPQVAKAKDDLSESIRRNPLAAVGIAFTAGLLIALLARG